MPTISARVSDEDEDELDEVADLLGEDRSTTIRKALREGLRELRIRRAIEGYQSGDLPVKQAARVAGLDLGEWLVTTRERNLTTQLSPADLERDADAAREL